MDTSESREVPLADTHLRLLEAAAALFRTKGYAATTTRELATLVGVKNASLYHHIRKKDDLLYTLCVDSLSRIIRAAEEAVGTSADPLEQLAALTRTHILTSLADQDKHATMLMELRALSHDRRDEVVALRDRYEALVASILRNGQKAGAIRSDISARMLTLALLNLLNWTIFWYRPEGGLSAEEIADFFTSIYIEGVQRRPSISP